MKKFLMATDGSKSSEKTNQETINLAGSLEAEVTVITVMEEALKLTHIVSSDTIKKIKENHKKNLQKILNKAETSLKDKGIKVKTVLKNGHPADEICKLANEGKYDMVILGSRGPGGLQELFLGSVSNRVVHHAKPHVLIIK